VKRLILALSLLALAGCGPGAAVHGRPDAESFNAQNIDTGAPPARASARSAAGICQCSLGLPCKCPVGQCTCPNHP
jgi:hypothetical protein